ncbi:hypothetical protein EDD21DRAFT_366100 [Dissophora ornata]|nr:hypothetical protein EDD21DRAFT_366100 [Dissophora ornata]
MLLLLLLFSSFSSSVVGVFIRVFSSVQCQDRHAVHFRGAMFLIVPPVFETLVSLF